MPDDAPVTSAQCPFKSESRIGDLLVDDDE
jgi:hypothetical protein